MHDRYEYRTIQITRSAWPRVTAAIHRVPNVFGLWRGEIGWYTDEGVLMTAGVAAPEAVDGVIRSTVERLEATVRPARPDPPTADGVYAHRWFEVDPSDQPEFFELSQEAWQQWESAHHGTEVIGLWRSIDKPDRLLLVTRYASLAMWERSRPYNPTPTPGTDEARARFLRRAELTDRTVVRLGRLLRPPVAPVP